MRTSIRRRSIIIPGVYATNDDSQVAEKRNSDELLKEQI